MDIELTWENEMQLNFLWEVFQVRKPRMCLLIFFGMAGEEENSWQKYEKAVEIVKRKVKMPDQLSNNTFSNVWGLQRLFSG